MKNRNRFAIASGLVILIYFFSGVCSLMDEVVWVRLLKLTLGNTVYANSIVVSVFMGGLALGALIMGRYSDRIQKRLRLYAILELIATISALLFPVFLKLMDNVYRHIFDYFGPASKILLFVQIIVSAILLLIPTLAMGSTLPLLGRYITSLHEKVGRLVGRLYAVNMLGAALGCFLAGFVLIRVVGVMGTVYTAAAINLLVAAGGWILYLLFDFSTAEEKTSEEVIPADSGKKSMLPIMLIIAFFMSGFISIGYELIWMRSIVLLLGSPTYVFSAVLTIYLIGNVAGVWAGSRFSKILKNPALAFGISLTLLGIVGVFYINWLDVWQTKLLASFVRSTHNIWENAYVRALFFPVFNCFFLYFIPAFIMGIGFPFALQAWSNHRHLVGRSTATVYGSNTIGAVTGGLLVGFLFIPMMGVQHSILIMGLTGIWFGSLMVLTFWTRVKLVLRVPVLIVTILVTIIALSVPSDLFLRQFINISGSSTKVLAVKEGLNTTVSVHENKLGERTLATSNVQVAGDSKGFRVTQKILGHLGILLDEHPERALTVGFGSGESSDCMSKHNLKDGVDVAEIAPELVKMSLKYFRNINLGDSIDKKNVHIIYIDAKNYLHLTKRKYDVIVTDAISPRQVADNASLYTEEYFRSGLSRLKPGGIYGCWLPIQEIPISCINSILGTFRKVFPYVTVWFSVTAPSSYDFLYVAGSKKPQKYSLKHIDQEFRKKAVAQSLAYINFFNSHDVMSCYITDQEGLDKYLKANTFNINSDYKPYIEFNTDINEKMPVKKNWLMNFIKLTIKNDILSKIDWTGMTAEEKNNWIKEQQTYSSAARVLMLARAENDPVKILQYCYEGESFMPSNVAFMQQEYLALLNLHELISRQPRSIEHIIKSVNAMLQQEPSLGSAWLVRSWVMAEIQRGKEAYEAAENAANYAPKNAMAQYNMGLILMGMQNYNKAASYLEEAVELDSTNIMYHSRLIKAYSMGQKYDKTLKELYALAKLDPDNYKIYFNIGELCNMMGKKDDAVKAYRKCLKIKPDFVEASNKLSDISQSEN